MNSETNKKTRPPVVAIMGHVDHGKSTLLDYIQKTNVVAGEAGGITQHLSAYEATVKGENGEDRKITFIDTPGHAAFSGMRQRGATVADIAILIIAADDGVKTQTIEAIKTIQDNNVPFVVAFNKIDKPGANIEKTKADLLEHNVYVEGFGGDIPFAAISAKSGEGVDNLLETILLVADLEELTGQSDQPAEGFVIESHLDPKRGVSATLVIKNGTMNSGNYIVINDCIAKGRLMENWHGQKLEEATFSTPVTVIGFNNLPEAGHVFTTHDSKKEAEKAAASFRDQNQEAPYCISVSDNVEKIIPLVIKTDVGGTLEAIVKEIEALNNDTISFKIIKTGIGTINESDLQIAAADGESIIVGFNVDTDKKVSESNDASAVTVQTFSIIYKLTEWLAEEQEKRRPRKEVEEVLAKIKALKIFSTNKGSQIIGGKVTEGNLTKGSQFKITRRGEFLGRGKFTSLQLARSAVEKVESGNEFGAEVESKYEIAEGDVIETYHTIVV